MGLLKTLRPEWWFAAHLHVRFEATVVHEPETQPLVQPIKVENPDEIQIDDDEFDDTPSVKTSEEKTSNPVNPDEIKLDSEDETTADATADVHPPHPGFSRTNFLALDKCLPRRQFLEVVDIPTPMPSSNQQTDATASSSEAPSSSPNYIQPTLSFDPEWLAITRAFQPWYSTTHQQRSYPNEQQARTIFARELKWVTENVKMDEDGHIPVQSWQTFVMTAPGPGSEGPKNKITQRELL